MLSRAAQHFYQALRNRTSSHIRSIGRTQLQKSRDRRPCPFINLNAVLRRSDFSMYVGSGSGQRQTITITSTSMCRKYIRNRPFHRRYANDSQQNRLNRISQWRIRKTGRAGRAGRRTFIRRPLSPSRSTYCYACRPNSYGYGLRNHRWQWAERGKTVAKTASRNQRNRSGRTIFSRH